MRILLAPLTIVLVATALPASGQSAVPPPTIPAHCTLPGADKASAPAKPVAPQQLGELPPASAIATVWRFDEKGCPKPVVLKRGIGANPEKAVEPSGYAKPAQVR